MFWNTTVPPSTRKEHEENHSSEVQRAGPNERREGPPCTGYQRAPQTKEPGDLQQRTRMGGGQLTSCCREELPEKIQIFFTICLKYYLEHTYMKNYSSFAENSNLMGPPGFLLAVFGNCVPRPHGSQTLEGEKATNPLHV